MGITVLQNGWYSGDDVDVSHGLAALAVMLWVLQITLVLFCNQQE